MRLSSLDLGIQIVGELFAPPARETVERNRILRTLNEATPAPCSGIRVEDPVQPEMAGLFYFPTGLPKRGMDSGGGHTLLAAMIYHIGVVEIKTQYPTARSVELG
jgi:hypothetical protein